MSGSDKNGRFVLKVLRPIRASAHPREHLQSNHARDQPRCGIFPLSWIGGPGRDRTDDLFHAMEVRKS